VRPAQLAATMDPSTKVYGTVARVKRVLGEPVIRARQTTRFPAFPARLPTLVSFPR
jgi:hypothetical protein